MFFFGGESIISILIGDCVFLPFRHEGNPFFLPGWSEEKKTTNPSPRAKKAHSSPFPPTSHWEVFRDHSVHCAFTQYSVRVKNMGQHALAGFFLEASYRQQRCLLPHRSPPMFWHYRGAGGEAVSFRRQQHHLFPLPFPSFLPSSST